MTADVAVRSARAAPVPRFARLRGLAALLALLGVVVGIPAALVFLGQRLPLDVTLLTPDALMRPDDGRLLILVLFTIGWLAWVPLTASIAVEIVAVVRGIPAPSLPGVDSVQRIAAGLVAAAALLTVNPAAMGFTRADASTAAAVASLTVDSPPVSSEVTGDEPAHPVSAGPSPTYPTIIVRRHDTLWSLAQQHLGDGARYTEILELNRGVPQQDGRRLDNASWLYPGWILRLPEDARLADAGGNAPAADVVVQPGDTLWDIAQAELGDGARYLEIFAENEDDPQPGGGHLTDPDLILVGWELEIPGVSDDPEAPPIEAAALPGQVQQHTTTAPEHDESRPAPVPEAALPPNEIADNTSLDLSTPVDAQSNKRIDADNAAAADEAGDIEEPADVAPSGGLLALGIGGIALAGFVGEVTRRRRYQQRVRKTGERIPMPDPAAAAVETQVRSLADTPRAELLRDALRALAASARESGRPLPDVRTVRITSDGIHLLVLGNEAPLVPFTAGCGGTWVLDHVMLAAAEHGAIDPYPALVTIGADGDGLVMLNLESVGGLAVTGEGDTAVAGVIRALAADLALTPGASTILLQGVARDLAATLDAGRVTVAADVEHLERHVTAHERLIGARLQATGRADLRQLRGECEDEVAAGCLVVVSETAIDSAPAPWSGVVRVQAGRFTETGDCQMDVHSDGTAELPITGDTVQPLMLRESVAASIASTLDVADRPCVMPPVTDARNADAEPTAAPLCHTGPRVLLLGRVEVMDVAGKSVDQRMARLTEAVAYLALNPDATREELAEAIWAGRRVEPATKWNLISRMRTWLGVDEHGQHYLQVIRINGTDRLRLSAAVSSDWQDFQRLAQIGLRDEADPQVLDEALDLVRGRPFLGIDPRRYAWAEPHIQQMVSQVLDCATASAERHRLRGDPSRVRKSAVCGLSVDPTNERLADMAINACLGLGDHASAARLRDRLDLELIHLDSGALPAPSVSDRASA